MKHFWTILAISCMAIGCQPKPTKPVSSKEPADQSKPAANSTDDSEQTKMFKKLVHSIMENRKSLEPVSEQVSVAFADCAAPSIIKRESKPSPKLMISQSSDQDTHGKKLYYLYVKYKEKYLQISDPMAKLSRDSRVETSPVGQVLIKDSFFHNKSAKDSVLEPGKRYAYFVMTKLKPETPETDKGWIYATVEPDGKTISAVGKIESCMNCHKEANHDRLFGIPEPK